MPSTDTRGPGRMDWQPHVVRAGDYRPSIDADPDPEDHRDRIEPWLSALFQAEHLNLLVGSGLTTAIARAAGADPVDMTPMELRCRHADAVNRAAEDSARRLGRGEANIEDQARAILELIGGLRVLAGGHAAGDGDDDLCQGRRRAAASVGVATGQHSVGFSRRDSGHGTRHSIGSG